MFDVLARSEAEIDKDTDMGPNLHIVYRDKKYEEAIKCYRNVLKWDKVMICFNPVHFTIVYLHRKIFRSFMTCHYYKWK